VWIPATIKERVRDFIPKEVIDKIATENDVKTVDELKAFLEKKKHPVVERWKAAPVEVVPEVTEEAPLVAPVSVSAVSAGGFKIILKDAKIHAKKVIVRATEEE